jgi:formylglycine-generating enzyme required for sulfatase activity
MTWNKDPHRRLLEALALAEQPLTQFTTSVVRIVDGVELRFRWCPSGKFMMGLSEAEAVFGAEQHEVELTRGFWLGETQVTQLVWQAVMGSNPSRYPGTDRPVEQVSWDDCQKFLSRVNGLQADLQLRLPTEAEWEYACRAGTTGATWLGENSVAVLNRIAWYSSEKLLTQPVKQKEANPWGMYDMFGNVWEWCSDWYQQHDDSPAVDPAGPATGEARVARGHSFEPEMIPPRAGHRGAWSPHERDKSRGFRLARWQ